MSNIEHHIGKLVEVKPAENETFEAFLTRLLKEAGKLVKPDYYKSTEEWFEDESYRKYVKHKGKVYKIVDDKEFEDHDDIAKASLNADGSIDYQLRWYNGGASMNEMFEEALKHIEP